LGWRLAEANGCKAIASLILLWPTGRALLSRGIDWLLTFIAEAQLSEALASVISGFVEALARPASLITLTCRISAVRANGRALARLWELLRWLTKANGCEAHACFVLRWPAGWAFLAWCVYRLLAVFAEPKLRKALASGIRCVIEAAAGPARIITFACGIRALGTQLLAAAMCRQRLRCREHHKAGKKQHTHDLPVSRLHCMSRLADGMAASRKQA